MHERTQRAIARLLFVFCCALPTTATIGCVLVTWTPWYHQRVRAAIELEISRETGLVVHIDDYHRRAPATIQLTGVRLIQPETLRRVAVVRQLEWDAAGDHVSILLRQPELQSAELESAWRLVHDRFLCRPERTGVPVRFAANDLTVHSDRGAITLRDVDAWIGTEGRNVRASLQCVPAGVPTAAPVTVTVNRDRSGSEPTTRWLLDSGETPLPCSALSDYLPLLVRLGGEAEFRGRMRWHRTQRHAWIDLAGARFDNVSLDRLFENQSHRLSGRATVEFDRCRIDPDSRHRDIVGTIRATDGAIGRSLLLSAGQHLGFETTFPDGVTDLPYDLLALQFNLNNAQLQLTGICRGEVGYEGIPDGVVVCRDGYPLVRSSPAALDALAVANAIAPQHSLRVPLSAQTQWLADIFVPPAAPLPLSEPRIQRIAERWDGEATIRQPDLR